MNTSPFVQRIRHWVSASAQRIGHWVSTSRQYVSDRISTLPLLISVAALTVSSLHYYAVARHHRLSVKPHVVITFTLEGSTGEKNGIYIANPGLGPAIMKALSVEVGGTAYDAMDKRVWRNIFRDLAIVPGCFRQGWAQPGSALKPGDEIGLLTLTHAKPPVVDERACQFELLKFLKAEGLKVRMQYESMYGEPNEAIHDSWIDNDTIFDIALTKMQQIAPKIVEQVQSMLPQFQQLVDRLQQMQVDAIKRMPDLAGLMLLQELYEDPPGAPPGWWLQQRGSPMKPKE